MKINSKKILVDVGEVQANIGGLILPSHLERPSMIGRVVVAGSRSGWKKGDYALLHLKSSHEVNGMRISIVSINNKKYLLMRRNVPLARFREYKDGAKLRGKVMDRIKLNPDQFESVGNKILLEFEAQKKETLTGIMLPEKTIHERLDSNKPTYGKIISVGKDANNFTKGECLKAGRRVMMIGGIAGGTLPLEDHPESWSCIGNMVSMRQLDPNEEDKGAEKTGWVPVGGWLLLQPLYNGIEMRKGKVIGKRHPNSKEDTVLEEKGVQFFKNNIEIPISALPVPKTFKVITQGPGWSDHYLKTIQESPVKIENGDVVLCGTMMDHRFVELDGVTYVFCRSNRVDMVLKDKDVVDSLLPLRLPMKQLFKRS